MNITENFFDNLYQILDDDNDSDQENLCLITGEQLLKDSIKLECSHSFNYIPLFNEVKKQKGNFIPNSKPSNYYESDRLNKYQFKCPYCRKKYKHAGSLWNHKKKCTGNPNNLESTNLQELVIKLLTDNLYPSKKIQKYVSLDYNLFD